jgi:hypothetical protein
MRARLHSDSPSGSNTVVDPLTECATADYDANREQSSLRSPDREEIR